MRVLLAPDQSGDNPQLLPLLEGISVVRLGPGRPRCRPQAVIANKSYSHPSTRKAMRHRRIPFVCPEPEFAPQVYKHRNVVARCFNRLKQFRDLATR